MTAATTSTFQTSAPTPLPTVDYGAFLAEHAAQPHGIMRYDLEGETLWVKKANAGNPGWHYRLLDMLAGLLSLPVLEPVPNPGGAHTIRTEIRRLHNFAAAGLRVPQVLAVADTAFVMCHLGRPGQEAPSLSNAMESAIGQGSEAVLALWSQGLHAIAEVHARGEVLSQAAARNMVCCADGAIGFIDFEDDPAAHLPRAVCLARDALNYAQSTALFVDQGGAMAQAQKQWAAFVRKLPMEARQVLERTVSRLAWVRFLPRNQSLGRDALRVRAAYDLLAAPRQAEPR
ncbi:hypothetical protein GCM10010975_23790 [Comamonas phosphati]|nr:hypothetical protein GCM10010975_23790 [Comamonas phosphati]